MNGLQEAVLKRAKEYNFQLLTSNPDNLKDYVFKNIIVPIVRPVAEVRTSFYGVKDLLDGKEILLVDKKIKLQTYEDKFHILTDEGEGPRALLTVEFENDIAYVEKISSPSKETYLSQLTHDDLTQAIENLYR